MIFQVNDGGRAAAGFRGQTGDCVCRAIAIATELPYAQIYAELNKAALRERPRVGRRKRSSARTGVQIPTIRHYLASIGWRWVPTMQVGSGCKVHLRAEELPSGRLIVAVSRHVVAVIDGVVHDTHDPTRDGTRCVYGYYIRAKCPGREHRDHIDDVCEGTCCTACGGPIDSNEACRC